MKKAVQILTIILTSNLTVFGQEMPTPDNYSIVDTVTGDLDNDKVKELVVAYNTEREDKIEGFARELIIYL